MHKLSLTLSALVILTAALAAHTFAKPQNQCDTQNLPSHEDQFTAVAIVRTINTAEVAYLYGKAQGSAQPRNRYAAWSDLYASGLFEEVKQSAPDAWSLMSADGVRGYNLSLIVSPEGKAYQLALHDAKPQSGRFSVFSDQSGLIYTGAPLR